MAAPKRKYLVFEAKGLGDFRKLDKKFEAHNREQATRNAVKWALRKWNGRPPKLYLCPEGMFGEVPFEINVTVKV